MRERPIIFSGPMVKAILEGRKTMTRRPCKGQRELSNIHDFQLDCCPYGVPGDRLWVRETWKCSSMSHHTPTNGTERVEYGISYKPDGCFPNCKTVKMERPVDNAWQKNRDGWRPSIHMPRWASRITLEITNVRVERLQEIREKDCFKEGIDFRMEMFPQINREIKAQACFQRIWNFIYGKDAWDNNPWVWVIEFSRAGGSEVVQIKKPAE
jgi:hypothetical protein